MDEADPERWFTASVGPLNLPVNRYVLGWFGSFAASLVLVGIVDTVTRYRYALIIGLIPGALLVLPPLVFGGYLAVRRLRKFTIGVAHDGLTVNGRRFAFGDARLGRWQVLQFYGDMAAGTALCLRSGSRRFVLGGRDYRVPAAVRLEADPVNRVDAWVWDSDFAELLTQIPGLDAGGPAPGETLRCLLFRRPARGKVNPKPSLAVDLSADTITVINPDTEASVATCAVTEVVATPAVWIRPERYAATWPVLVVRIPGSQVLSMTCLDGNRLTLSTNRAHRFSWGGELPEKHEPGYLVSAADWLTLVEKVGLAPLLQDGARTATGSRKARADRGAVRTASGHFVTGPGLVRVL